MTTPTDTAKLADEIEALAKEATPGPWMLWRASDAKPHELMSQHRYGDGMHRICEISHYGWRRDVAMEVAAAQLANGILIEALVNKLPAIVSALREVDALQKEVARLRGALEPFAKGANAFDTITPGGLGRPCPDAATYCEGAEVTVGDFRRARAALGGGG